MVDDVQIGPLEAPDAAQTGEPFEVSWSFSCPSTEEEFCRTSSEIDIVADPGGEEVTIFQRGGLELGPGQEQVFRREVSITEPGDFTFRATRGTSVIVGFFEDTETVSVSGESLEGPTIAPVLSQGKADQAEAGSDSFTLSSSFGSTEYEFVVRDAFEVRGSVETTIFMQRTGDGAIDNSLRLEVYVNRVLFEQRDDVSLTSSGEEQTFTVPGGEGDEIIFRAVADGFGGGEALMDATVEPAFDPTLVEVAGCPMLDPQNIEPGDTVEASVAVSNQNPVGALLDLDFQLVDSEGAPVTKLTTIEGVKAPPTDTVERGPFSIPVETEFEGTGELDVRAVNKQQNVEAFTRALNLFR